MTVNYQRRMERISKSHDWFIISIHEAEGYDISSRIQETCSWIEIYVNE